MTTDRTFIEQGIAFTSTERNHESSKQAAAARQIAATDAALNYWPTDVPLTKCDLNIITDRSFLDTLAR